VEEVAIVMPVQSADEAWMDPIMKFIQEGQLPANEKAAKKVK